MKKKYKTVIISDVHLGKPNNLSNKLVDFLETIDMEQIIFNWDLIDFRQLETFWKRTDKETEFTNYMTKLIEKWVHVTYIKGNHDKFMQYLNHVKVHNIKITQDLYYTSGNQKKYYICHWDRFDFINNHLVFLWRFSNIIYSLIYLIEKIFNKKTWTKWHIPVSEKFKMRLKKKLFPERALQNKAMKLAEKLKCDWVILWHYHMPKQISKWDKEYINSWDWLISCSAIVETKEWDLKLVYYK